jgi:hypothetical protein
MFSPKIKIDKDLYERVVAAAARAGYSSADEFIIHILEREVKGAGESEKLEEVKKQLRGLGYIE